MKTGKSPYELRLELMQMAERIVRERKLSQLYSDGKTPESHSVDVTEEEIIESATKLNEFMSKKHD